jgi:hypothetical protein
MQTFKKWYGFDSEIWDAVILVLLTERIMNYADEVCSRANIL